MLTEEFSSNKRIVVIVAAGGNVVSRNLTDTVKSRLLEPPGETKIGSRNRERNYREVLGSRNRDSSASRPVEIVFTLAVSIKVFLALLESRVKCERQMAIKNSSYKKYEAKWTTLCISDMIAFAPLSK